MASVKQSIILILTDLLIIYRGSNHFVFLMSRVDFQLFWYPLTLWHITIIILNHGQILAKFVRMVCINHVLVELTHHQLTSLYCFN